MQKKAPAFIKAVIVLTVTALLGMSLSRPARSAGGQAQEPAASIEFFEKKIRPVLAENCYQCHSAQSNRVMGGFMLDTREGLLKGGASGRPAIIPGDPENSPLVKAIRYTDPKLQMPMAGKLPDQVIRDFEAWVKMGAPDPRKADKPIAASDRQPYDYEAAKKFWSYQPIKDPSPPQVRNQAWVKSPVDNFILAKLEEKNLKPVADADKRTLIRRATFDLTGLPPTPEEVEAFLSDQSPAAFEKVVDRLLASPAYGEKWGRHWLDVVRYADTAGCNSDFPVPSAYRYRNYVINSFNQDKPYDQFVREQLAGDLLPGKTEAEKYEKVIATGYIAMSRRFGSRKDDHHLTIDDTIDNLGKAFLGLSISCARCHDHKFDPIPNRDYYALYGILSSTKYPFAGVEIYPHPYDFVPLAEGKKAEAFNRWQSELRDLDDKKEELLVKSGQIGGKIKILRAGLKAGAEIKDKKDGTEAKPALVGDVSPDKVTAPQPPPTEAEIKTLEAQLEATKKEREIVIGQIAEKSLRPPQVEKAYAVSEGKAADAQVLRKGDPKNKGEVVPRGFLTILGGEKVPADYKGSGRDLLANWIADPKNPLTARVMVNRIWQYHFGKGLVETPNDFGARGLPPTHPELLDYLAARFIEGGWSVKKMHRLVMLSHAYQLSSAGHPKNAAADVANDYLWRFNRRRLDAEEIRDAILAIGGALDRTMGETHPFPPEATWRFTQHEQFFAVYETNRRSVYVMQQRIKKHPFFEVFDGADQNAITGSRPLSTTPVQALFLMNNPFMHQQSENFAVRVGMAYDTLPERIDYAYRLAYGRPAKPEEIKEAAAYLQQVSQDFQAANTPADRLTRASLASYLRVMLSSNEFLYVD